MAPAEARAQVFAHRQVHRRHAARRPAPWRRARRRRRTARTRRAGGGVERLRVVDDDPVAALGACHGGASQPANQAACWPCRWARRRRRAADASCRCPAAPTDRPAAPPARARADGRAPRRSAPGRKLSKVRAGSGPIASGICFTRATPRRCGVAVNEARRIAVAELDQALAMTRRSRRSRHVLEVAGRSATAAGHRAPSRPRRGRGRAAPPRHRAAGRPAARAPRAAAPGRRCGDGSPSGCAACRATISRGVAACRKTTSDSRRVAGRPCRRAIRQRAARRARRATSTGR